MTVEAPSSKDTRYRGVRTGPSSGPEVAARSGRNEYSARAVPRHARCPGRPGARLARPPTWAKRLAAGRAADLPARANARRGCSARCWASALQPPRDAAVAAPPAKSGQPGHAARKNFHGHWGHCLSERSTWRPRRPRRPLGPLRCPFVDSPATLGHLLGITA